MLHTCSNACPLAADLHLLCYPISCCFVLVLRTEAREELRRQVGTLRFDLNTLASTKGKEAKKDALAARKEFIRAVSVLPLWCWHGQPMSC